VKAEIQGRHIRKKELKGFLEELQSLDDATQAQIEDIFSDMGTVTVYEITGKQDDCIKAAGECLSGCGKRIMLLFGGLESKAPVADISDKDQWSWLNELSLNAGWQVRSREPFSRIVIIAERQVLRFDEPLMLTYGDVLRSSKGCYLKLVPFAAGGTSICYKAVDGRGEPVLIKEVYPMSLGRRLTRRGGKLEAAGSSAAKAETVMKRLGEQIEKSRAEKKLERELVQRGFEFFEPNYDYFEANNTFYTVYRDYGKGTLDSLVGKLDLRQAAVLTKRILEALEELHKAGYLHLDISPENILLGANVDGVPMLKFIDLGSLIKVGEVMERDTFPCKDGYSPFELFSAPSSGEARLLIGKHTDTFSVGAVFYHLITGNYVSWDICRSGAKNIVSKFDPAIENSLSRMITFPIRKTKDGNDYSGISIGEKHGLSPRVIEGAGALLARSISNNPARRFADAAGMSAAIDELIELIDGCRFWFEKMDMPFGFMGYECDGLGEVSAIRPEEIIREDEERRKKLAEKEHIFKPEDIRKALLEKKSFIIDKGSSEHMLENIECYIDRYGSEYSEILFVDERNATTNLFSKTDSGEHGNVVRPMCDGKTLIVFCGREDLPQNGIVHMVVGEEYRYSLQYMPKRGSEPHVILCRPAYKGMMRRYFWPVGTALLSVLIVAMLGTALIFGGYNDILGAFMAPDAYVHMETADGVVLNEGTEYGAMIGNARGAMSEAVLFGNSNSHHFDEDDIGFPAYCVVTFGWLPCAVAALAVVGSLWGLIRLSKNSRLSQTCVAVLAADIVIPLLSGLTLIPGIFPADMNIEQCFTRCIILAVAAAAFGVAKLWKCEKISFWKMLGMMAMAAAARVYYEAFYVTDAFAGGGYYTDVQVIMSAAAAVLLIALFRMSVGETVESIKE